MTQRKEHNVATKLAIAKDVQAMMKASCAVKEVRRRAMRKYGLSWRQLKKCVENFEEC